ncbi:hypothetical protein [Micromonospora sp. DT229]|uniref:hypothetical protein n=1 Tax=Micromonospora sp. DT229 TaxID=3393430 RepID=UPI003CF2C5A7
MTTRYVYNRRGRLVRSVTTRESSWTEQDRAEVLALALYRSQLCPCGCGQRYADTTSPEDTGPQFVASRKVCRARMTLLEAQQGAETNNAAIAGSRLWQVRTVRG